MNRKILYGYQMRDGELTVQPQEAEGVRRVFSLYLAGMAQQRIADTLNADSFCYSAERPMWSRQRVTQTLRNPRYAGEKGHPALIDGETFRKVQSLRTERMRKRGDHPALCLTKKLRCGHCGHPLRRSFQKQLKEDTLRFLCDGCGARITIPDADLLAEVERQAAEYVPPSEGGYAPSEDVIRLSNAVNRGLEKPDNPEDVVSLILQGISARYACVPMRMASADILRLIREKDYDRAIQSIAITSDNAVTVTFK